MHRHSESVIRFDRCAQLETSLIFLHRGENLREVTIKTETIPTNSRNISKKHKKHLRDIFGRSSFIKFISTVAWAEQTHFLAVDVIADDKCVIHSLRFSQDYKLCLTRCLFKFELLRLWILLVSSLFFVLSLLPGSNAAGHYRVYFGAGLDHLSRHGGKQEARCRCVFQLLDH